MISVCITTYNGEKYIREQLESILTQLAQTDEVVLSDDGSTDATLSIVEALHDPRIHVLHHDSSAIAGNFPLDRPTHNFENAIRHAKGDIIFLSDQDDVWMPNKVSIMCQALQTYDMAVHDCVVMDDSLTRVIEPSYLRFIGARSGVWRNLIRCSYLGCCMAMRRCVIERALPFPSSGVGHDLWLGIVSDMYFRTTFIKQVLLRYRKHADSQTTSGTPSRYGLRFKIRYRLTILKHIISIRHKYRS